MKTFLRAFHHWQQDHANVYAAAIAYYGLFSLGPLLLVIISLLGFFYGEHAARGQLFQQLSGVIDAQNAKTLQSFIAHSRNITSNLFSLVTGIILLFLGATGIFGQIQEAFITIWHIPPEKKTIKELIVKRFMAFVLVLLIAMSFILSFIFSAIISFISIHTLQTIAGMNIFLYVLNLIIPLCITTLLFTFLYRVLSDIHVPFHFAFLGGLVAAILFTIGKTVLAYIITLSASAQTYGASSSLIAILLWIYYSSLILLFGLEYTKAISLEDRVFHQYYLQASGQQAVIDEKLTQEEKKKYLSLGYVLVGFFSALFKRHKKHRFLPFWK